MRLNQQKSGLNANVRAQYPFVLENGTIVQRNATHGTSKRGEP